MENAHLHSAISIASLATAIAAVTAFCNQDSFKESKMSSALASASELLASHCLELAELSGADHDRIVSAVRSAVDVRGPGDLLTLTAAAATGVLRWKHIKVCINKKSQVVVEIKSKHVRGAFSMKSKGIVTDVCETVSDLQNEKEKENNAEELYFGISTGKGLIKFKCKSKADKQTWVDSIRNLLHRVTAVEVINTSLETTNIGDST